MATKKKLGKRAVRKYALELVAHFAEIKLQHDGLEFLMANEGISGDDTFDIFEAMELVIKQLRDKAQ